jgi:hypothetical protein
LLLLLLLYRLLSSLPKSTEGLSHLVWATMRLMWRGSFAVLCQLLWINSHGLRTYL